MPSGLPVRQPRPLPPNVLDIHAPQFALPEPRPKGTRQRRTVPARRPALPAPRRLSSSEERLAEWMYRHLSFRFGARALVRRYGTKAILDALHDGIMIWTTHTLALNDPRRTLPAGVSETVEERIVNPAIILPPAYLCHVLKGLDRR